jgi:paraquat-inducible protein B
MSRKANALRIGLFALGGVALLVAAVVTVFSGRLFDDPERAIMHFKGSVYGLQVGAPVVFRGVRLGKVVSLSVVHDPATGAFGVPVVAEIDRAMIRSTQNTAPSLQQLVQRGLRAQLLTQSLLTGQLYVDLDITPGAVTAATAASGNNGGLVEIPTSSTALQTLFTQLQGVNARGIVDDVAATVASAKQLLGSAQLQKALEEIAAAAGTLQRMGSTLERRIGPLADAAQGTLADTRRAVGSTGAAADRVAAAADRVGSASGRIDALLAPDSPLVARVQQAADELARTAAALRQATAEESPVMQNVERALQDASRAARAVRELADQLERQPESLLRGRRAPP